MVQDMRRKPYVAAAVAAFASIGAAGYSAWVQADDAMAMQTGANAALAPIPPGILSSGMHLPAQPAPMRPEQRRALAVAASHTPLDQEIFNLFYADQVRSGAPIEQVRRLAQHLARLGWRYTPAQQNLILRNMLDGDYDTIVDRADSLVRRQKIPEFAFAILSAMEAIPEVHSDVVGKLRSNPVWRRDYLSVITPGASPAQMAARVDTIENLLRSPGGISRAEAAQSLTSLLESGRGRIAHRLWRRLTRPSDPRNLVLDPSFRQAAIMAGSGVPTIALDWQFGQDLGFSAVPSPDGVVINWDHRGAPTFITQTVALPPGRSLALTITTPDQQGVAALLHPTLECGRATIEFTGTAIAGGVRYTTPAVPKSCDIAILRVGGVVDAGTGQVMLRITKVDLRPAS